MRKLYFSFEVSIIGLNQRNENFLQNFGLFCHIMKKKNEQFRVFIVWKIGENQCCRYVQRVESRPIIMRNRKQWKWSEEVKRPANKFKPCMDMPVVIHYQLILPRKKMFIATWHSKENMIYRFHQIFNISFLCWVIFFFYCQIKSFRR